MNHSGFHTETAPSDSNVVIAGLSLRCPCKILQQIAQMLTPKDSMVAPTATCAVATSAALLLQMVQAPSPISHTTRATQTHDTRRSAATWRASIQTRRQNTTPETAMI